MAFSWNQFFLNCSRVIIQPWSDHAPATSPPPLGASTQAATGHDAPDPIWCQSQKNSPDKLTPLFVGSATTRWYKATSPLEKECPTFLPAAPTLPTIRTQPTTGHHI